MKSVIRRASLAFARALLTLVSTTLDKREMMEITTSNSMRVNPVCGFFEEYAMGYSQGTGKHSVEKRALPADDDPEKKKNVIMAITKMMPAAIANV